MLRIIGFEEIFWLGHKALDLARQQHLRQDVPRVEDIVLMYRIAD
jgi:hypothetical protein